MLVKHRDLAGRRHEAWVRRALLLLPLAVVAAALANVFGQQASTRTVAAPGATLELRAPAALRPGLLWQARFRITAERALQQPALVLDRGWLDGMTINTIEPAPAEESSEGDRLVLKLQPLQAGETASLTLAFQVNPTTFGSQDQGVRLLDGGNPVVSLSRSVRIFP